MSNYGKGKLFQVIFTIIILIFFGMCSGNEADIKNTENITAKIIDLKPNIYKNKHDSAQHSGDRFFFETDENNKFDIFTLINIRPSPKIGDSFPIVINTYSDGSKKYLLNVTQWERDHSVLW